MAADHQRHFPGIEFYLLAATPATRSFEGHYAKVGEIFRDSIACEDRVEAIRFGAKLCIFKPRFKEIVNHR